MARHQAAVLGKPIAHSLSPLLHNAGYRALGLTQWEYTRIECDEHELPQVVASADASFRGFSVTMPGKFAALAVATDRTDRAQLIGSANTLVRSGDGWRADNTDCDGITGAIRTLFDAPSPQLGTAVIIGAGGTARPALWALAELGVSHVTIINRSDRSRELADLIAAIGLQVDFVPYDDTISTTCATADVIISTVPAAGIAEHVDKLAQAPLLDVIYDPWPTPLVTAARNRHLPAVGGHVMLAHQAYGQFEQFTGYPAPREAMWAALTSCGPLSQ